MAAGMGSGNKQDSSSRAQGEATLTNYGGPHEINIGAPNKQNTIVYAVAAVLIALIYVKGRK